MLNMPPLDLAVLQDLTKKFEDLEVRKQLDKAELGRLFGLLEKAETEIQLG